MAIMNKRLTPNKKISWKISVIIFYFCAVYFFLMGAGLIFIPHLLVMGITQGDVNPTIIGMLRGAGGATIPYSLLYIMVAVRPQKHKWGLYIIFMANVVAILLDLLSVLLGEYKWSYAMMDIPIELLSIVGIILLWSDYRKKAN